MASRTQHKNFTAEAIKRLSLLDLTTTTLARELECHRNAVYLAIYRAQCPRIHQLVCRRLKLKPII